MTSTSGLAARTASVASRNRRRIIGNLRAMAETPMIDNSSDGKQRCHTCGLHLRAADTRNTNVVAELKPQRCDQRRSKMISRLFGGN